MSESSTICSCHSRIVNERENEPFYSIEPSVALDRVRGVVYVGGGVPAPHWGGVTLRRPELLHLYFHDATSASSMLRICKPVHQYFQKRNVLLRGQKPPKPRVLGRVV